jgi:hypothetical protein
MVMFNLDAPQGFPFFFFERERRAREYCAVALG